LQNNSKPNDMRTNILPILTALLLSLCWLSADEAKAKIDFNGTDQQQVLQVYAKLSGLELITDSHVRHLKSNIVLHNSGLSNSEMMASVEKALIEQAGIVITHLDDKRASVTHNDALPITPSKH